MHWNAGIKQNITCSEKSCEKRGRFFPLYQQCVDIQKVGVILRGMEKGEEHDQLCEDKLLMNNEESLLEHRVL